jgi:hypothetical protein
MTLVERTSGLVLITLVVSCYSRAVNRDTHRRMCDHAVTNMDLDAVQHLNLALVVTRIN